MEDTDLYCSFTYSKYVQDSD